MELLQKLTLYDLLGYTLPGCLLVYLLNYANLFDIVASCEEYSIHISISILILGYIVGIMISEIMRWVLDIIFSEKVEWKRICERYHIAHDNIGNALFNAKLINSTESIKDYDSAYDYRKQMYGDIQVDSKYNRIHNYASAELLYKNMILVAIVCVGNGIVLSIGELVLAGIVGTLCFSLRWKRFYEKKLGYMLCWFVEKYREG